MQFQEYVYSMVWVWVCFRYLRHRRWRSEPSPLQRLFATVGGEANAWSHNLHLFLSSSTDSWLINHSLNVFLLWFLAPSFSREVDQPVCTDERRKGALEKWFFLFIVSILSFWGLIFSYFLSSNLAVKSFIIRSYYNFQNCLYLC